jgi:leader peptidase (prepilin peptidase)/N-methyltransferase
VEVFYTAFFALLGLMLGSFLNVCIDRLPAQKSIVSPPSKCDACGRRLSPQDLIPVVSYLWLRGRCRYCGAPIPKRVFVVELVTGFMLAFLYQYFGLTAEFGVTAFWAMVFILIFFIDLEHGLILNKIVYPSMVIAILLAAFAEPEWMEGWRLMPVATAALGGAVGLILFWIIAVISGGGMGWGDVKLAALIGLASGFPLVLVAVVLGAVLGGLAAAVLLLVGKRRWGKGQTIPFGPSLAVGAMVTIIWGVQISDWYLGLV